MTAPAERCKVCDREGCDRRAASIAYHRAEIAKSPDLDALLERLCVSQDECAKHRVDWRDRSRAAEALLREALDDVHEDRADNLHDRIREHLRGRR